jgi:hypothetical protein
MSRRKHEDASEAIEAVKETEKAAPETEAERDVRQLLVHSAAMGDEVATLRAAILEHKQAAWRAYGHPRPCDLKLYGVLD